MVLAVWDIIVTAVSIVAVALPILLAGLVNTKNRTALQLAFDAAEGKPAQKGPIWISTGSRSFFFLAATLLFVAARIVGFTSILIEDTPTGPSTTLLKTDADETVLLLVLIFLFVASLIHGGATYNAFGRLDLLNESNVLSVDRNQALNRFKWTQIMLFFGAAFEIAAASLIAGYLYPKFTIGMGFYYGLGGAEVLFTLYMFKGYDKPMKSDVAKQEGYQSVQSQPGEAAGHHGGFHRRSEKSWE